uniref:Uncharacterized protein n=1 Tax=Arundo donax TaxID=35708 RepID=A0A0A9A2P2_ARUDO
MNKSCDDRGITDDQHLDCFKFTEEKRKYQRLNNAGVQIQDAKGNSKKGHLACLPKFQNKAPEASPCRNSYQALLISREMLVKGCGKLACVIRRTAAVCFTPSTGADEDDLPYTQLDKVTHALSREAFGPLYLVT